MTSNEYSDYAYINIIKICLNHARIKIVNNKENNLLFVYSMTIVIIYPER